jgi:PilZ domain
VGERRQDTRYPATWTIRLWLNEYCALTGRASNASAHGTWVEFDWLPSDLEVGKSFRVQVRPETDAEFTCIATVRHVGADGVGLEIQETLSAAHFGPESRHATPSRP